MKKFNVGDVVKISKDMYCPFTADGTWKKGKRLGVVIYRDDREEHHPYIVFTLQGDADGKHTWVYGAENLKLITPLSDSRMKAYG